MAIRTAVVPVLAAVGLGSLALARSSDPPLGNSTAPPHWNPTLARAAPEAGPIDVPALDTA